MADYEGSLPVKTVRDDEFKLKVVDGASGSSATKVLSIAQEGDAVTAASNDFGVPVFGEDASGNYKLLSLSASGEVNVAAANLDIRDLAFATDKVDVSGSSVTVSATDLDIRDLDFATDKVDVSGSSVTVSATDLDIRDLTHASDSVKIGDGTDFLAISGTGEASVKITNAQGADGAAAPSESLQIAGKDGAGNLQTIKTDSTGAVYVINTPAAGIAKICDYQTSATVGVGSAVNHDYVVSSGKTFSGKYVLVGARGATRVRVGTFNGTTFTPKFAFFQQIQDNKDHVIDCLNLLGNGTNAIRIEITNLDGQSSDVYSTLQGAEE